jgi:hypothetical protein
MRIRLAPDTQLLANSRQREFIILVLLDITLPPIRAIVMAVSKSPHISHRVTQTTYSSQGHDVELCKIRAMLVLKDLIGSSEGP